MITWYTIFSFSIISAALLIAILGIWLTAIIPLIDRWSKRFFLAYFTALMACSLVSLVDLIIYQYIGKGTWRIFGFLEVLLLSVPLPMLTAYLLHSCKKDIRKSTVFRVVGGCWMVFYPPACQHAFYRPHLLYHAGRTVSARRVVPAANRSAQCDYDTEFLMLTPLAQTAFTQILSRLFNRHNSDNRSADCATFCGRYRVD